MEENILRQTDKCFVLCIDPETKLPFMLNMGLKMADVCDLDNRPQHLFRKEMSVRNTESQADIISQSSHGNNDLARSV